MLENKYKQITISEHISLYDKIIAKDNFLRKLKENITENTNEKVKRKYKKLEEMLTEENLEKIQSSIDKNARQGYIKVKIMIFLNIKVM